MLWQAALLKKASAQSLSTKFDANELTASYLRRIAMLSTKENGPLKAKENLASKGVMVVVLPQLPGTFLDGAAMLGPTGPIVGLTLRHDRTDNLWFTLLHELAHFNLHHEELRGDSAAFVDDVEIQSEDIFEQEADKLARESLIPSVILSQVRWDDSSTADDIDAVASRARVHISIVAGRWQRDHQNYRKFARLIERDTVRPLLLQE